MTKTDEEKMANNRSDFLDKPSGLYKGEEHEVSMGTQTIFKELTYREVFIHIYGPGTTMQLKPTEYLKDERAYTVGEQLL